MYLSDKRIKQLYIQANALRQDVVAMLEKAGSGHSAGPLGMADIFAAMYFFVLNHDPKNPGWEERDRLILSNGHICPIQYAALAHAGYFPKKELMTLRALNTRLQGHPHRGALSGVETTSGPLGSGLSQGIGVALAAQLHNKRYRTYVMMSDGEHNAGNTWEAALFAGKRRLNNLTAIMDRNNIQIDGYTEDVMPLEPLRDKYEAFGWNVIDVDGHNMEEFIGSVFEAKAVYEKPTMIIAHTIPGKGVDFMERKFEWHGKPPSKQEATDALKQLRSMGGKISHW